MSLKSISTPPSQAGIFGVSAGINTLGKKFSPRAVVMVAILFIAIIKILDFIIYRANA
jgi:preprotein translocase subunit Sec61beta